MTGGSIWSRAWAWRVSIPMLIGMSIAGFLLGGAVGANGLWSATVAVWIQAIGSIAAIISAPYIAHEADRRRESSAARRFYDRLMDAISTSHRQVDGICEAIDTYRTVDAVEIILPNIDKAEDVALDNIMGLSITEWPDNALYKSAVDYIETRDGIFDLIATSIKSRRVNFTAFDFMRGAISRQVESVRAQAAHYKGD